MLYSSIFLLERDNKTILIFSIRMTCLAIITKSMLFTFIFKNRLQLLLKYHNANKSMNKVLALDFFTFWNLCFLIMKTFKIVQGTKSLGLEPLFFLTTWYTQFCELFCFFLYLLLFPPFFFSIKVLASRHLAFIWKYVVLNRVPKLITVEIMLDICFFASILIVVLSFVVITFKCYY